MNHRSFYVVIFATHHFISPVRTAGKSISYSDFGYLVKEATYVDKTLMIREVVKDLGHTIVLSAPRGFGKTSNLQMLKAFFQAEVDKKGSIVTSIKDMTKPIKDTPNFRLFQQTKITKHKNVMDKHFGKYPVILVDLKHVVGFTYLNETQDYLKEVLHETISEHSYLKDSEKLDNDEREFVRAWSSEGFKSEEMGTFLSELEKLSMCLFKHFDRTRVIVLVDHYDSPILYCVTHPNVAADAFNYVINVVQAFLLKPKDDFQVNTLLLNGVLQISHPSNAKVIKRYKFLEEHRFVPFVGFVDHEVFDLVGKYAIEVDNELLESVQNHFGGYQSLDNITVHNPWAVLNYLDRQKFDYLWARRINIPNLQAILKIPDIHQKLERLLKGLPTVLELKRCLSAENLKILQDLVNNPQKKNSCSTLFYSFLFDRGFLAYDSSVGDDMRYVIPNEEVKRYLWETLDE